MTGWRNAFGNVLYSLSAAVGRIMPLLPRGTKLGPGHFKRPDMWHSHDKFELMQQKRVK